MAKNENGTAVATEMINGNLVVVREPIMDKNGKQMRTQDGRDYFAYKTYGKVRGRDVKVDFSPKDMGGYEPLDILFDISPKAELIMSDEKMTNDKTGETTQYTAYKLRVIDEDGEIWECNVKPQRDSDKTLLKYLLTEVKKTAVKTA